MRAARYYGKEDIRVEEVDTDPCGDGQVRVRLAVSPLAECGQRLD